MVVISLTSAKVKKIVNGLDTIVMRPFEFNGMKIEVNYAKRAKHPKNWTIAEHYHPWFEFNYVSGGSLFTNINGSEILVNSGDSYIIPPGVPHSHRHNMTGDDGICIRFSISADDGNDIAKVLCTPHAAAFNSHIERIKLHGGIYRVQAEFTAWLMRMYDLWCTDVPAPAAVNTFAAQVILYLDEYYGNVMMDDIANAMNVSYRTLARRFAAETGMSVSDKLTEIRLTHAKRLLLSTDMNMYDIARRCGYENEFYFSRRFKQKVSVSPGEYRNKNKIKQ